MALTLRFWAERRGSRRAPRRPHPSLRTLLSCAHDAGPTRSPCSPTVAPGWTASSDTELTRRLCGIRSGTFMSITEAVAVSGVTGGDVDEARSHLEQRLAVVTERARRSPAH